MPRLSLLHNWREAALRIGVVFAFLCGISVAHAALRVLASGRQRRGRLIVLAIEFAVLAALALAPSPNGPRVPLLVVLAISMGMQNNAFSRIGPIRLNTAFITGDLEDLGEALAEIGAPAKRREARLRTAIFLTTWIAYGVGALLGAYGAVQFKAKGLWIPAGLVALAVAMVVRSPARES